MDRDEEELREKENMRVRKAKEIKSKPQHDKFITDIIEKSKSKTQPPFEHVQHPYHDVGKPVVQYSPEQKGAILNKEDTKKSKSHWNKPIAEDRLEELNELMGGSYMAVNETPVSPYKKKEIEKRLNNIRNGKPVENADKYEYFDSSKTMHL